MKKIFYTSLLALAIFTLLGSTGIPPQDECNKDITDKRGKMKPWEKGAWETGNYRNVFRDADYKKAAIDAKLAKAYYDGFLYLFSLMHLSGNYRIIIPGLWTQPSPP